ncbi:MAG: SoxR reducing system RseC family protein [Spirochaetales bacterium]|nr:SoxR reducing system RseC family protein [Spirochaetales bacterium]
MDEKALVVSIENGIEAVHFEKEECKSCTTGCAKIKNSFDISNPQNLDVKKGSVVVIRASKKAQAIQGLLALFIPFLCSIAGYLLGPSIAGLFRKTISNDARAIFVLLFLVLSSAIVFVITRRKPMPGKPEIVEVL